jgi:hypothetical protein
MSTRGGFFFLGGKRSERDRLLAIAPGNPALTWATPTSAYRFRAVKDFEHVHNWSNFVLYTPAL